MLSISERLLAIPVIMNMFIRAVRDIEFWRERLRDLKDPIKAIIDNFDWEPVDKFHLSAIRKHIQPHETVLDIGCGPGRIAHWFAPEQYTGIDFVPEFVELANERNPKYHFQVHDIKEPMPYEDNWFGLAIGISVREIFITGSSEEEWRKALKEILRVASVFIHLPYGNNDPRAIEKEAVVITRDDFLKED